MLLQTFWLQKDVFIEKAPSKGTYDLTLLNRHTMRAFLLGLSSKAFVMTLVEFKRAARVCFNMNKEKEKVVKNM